MRKTSINQLTTMRWGFDEDVIAYAQNGFDRIGVCRNKVLDFGIEKCCEILNEANVSVSSYGSLTFYSDLTGPSLKEQICESRMDFENAAQLDADCMILHSAGDCGHLRKNRFRVADRILDQLLPVAEEYGIPIALEPTCENEVSGMSHSHSLSDTVELIDKYQSESLGLALDLFHVGNAFLQVPQSWFGEHVQLIQLADFDYRNNVRRRAPIGAGELDWDAFCAYVEETNYDGVIEFELFGESFDLSSYEQTIHAVIDSLFVAPEAAPIEFESVKA